MKKLILTAASAILLASASLAATTTWTSSAIPFWLSSAGWNNGTPTLANGAILQNDLTSVFSIDIQSGTSALDPVAGITFNAGAGTTNFTLRTSSGAPGGFNLSTGGIINNDSHAQLFNVPVTMVSPSGLGGSAANQTWNAAAGNIVFSGTYGSGSTVSTVNNNGGNLTIGGAFNTTIGTGTGRGDIVGAGALIKNGTGTLTLGGATGNTFSGGLTLNGGTVVATKVNALGTGKITLNAGTTIRADLNSLAGNGVLSLQGNASLDFSGPDVLSLPSIGTNTLSFADSHGTAWAAGTTLTILDWVQGDQLRFGSAATGLTVGQIGQIVFQGFPNSYAAIDPSGFVVAVPEPSTAAVSLIGGFSLAIGLVIRRRRQ